MAPRGWRRIAARVRAQRLDAASGLATTWAAHVANGPVFDTLRVPCNAADIVAHGERAGCNLRMLDPQSCGHRLG